MKTKTIITWVVILGGAAAATWYFTRSKKTTAVSFTTAKVQRGNIGKSVTATGTVQPLDSVAVGAQVSGVVKTVYADFNDVVKEGQLLATVDASIIEAQAEQTKATLANAESNLQFQHSNYERQSQLFQLGAISKADYQLALNQYNSAKASVASARAQLQLVNKNLSYTKIYSPISGVVLNRNVSAGQTIASSFNAPTLFVIARDLTKMQVRAAVDEADIGNVRSGQHVTFTVDAFPDDLFEGTVQEVLLRATVSANVVTYTTLINVDNSSMKLKPGMTASINVYLEEDSNVLLIPAKAINFKPDSASLRKFTLVKAERKMPDSTRRKDSTDRLDTLRRQPSEKSDVRRSFVWIRKGDTLIEKRIMTGINDDANVMVIRGLNEGEEVITGMVKNGGTGNNATTQRSPFMPTPQRRGTTGGGGGPRH